MAEIEREFGVSIDQAEIRVDNFDAAKQMLRLIRAG
jgi:hypothetical protein